MTRVVNSRIRLLLLAIVVVFGALLGREASVAAQVLGFAGIDNNGLAGVELQLNSQLTGTPGRETIVRDPFGKPISIASMVSARQGRDAFLTLDHTIQANAEQVLKATVAK